MRLPLLRGLLILIALFSANAFPQERKRGRTTEDWRIRAKFHEPLIASTAQRYNVDPHLLWTIAYLESRFRSDAVSYKDGKPCAYGLMQFTVPTAIRYGLTNPQDPRDSIDAAARYVRDLQTRFGPRADLILAAYNAGEGTVEAFREGKTVVLPNNKIINPHGLRTGGIPPYKETQHYVAQGGIIYRNIARAAIFQQVTLVESPQSARIIDRPVNTGRQDSFYTSGGATKHTPTHHLVKPAKPNTNDSIYVN